MHGIRISLGFACLAVALIAGTGCSPKVDEAAEQEKARQEELTALKERKQALDLKRAERREIARRLAGEEPAEGGATGEAAEGEAAPELTPEELQAQANQLDQEIEAEAPELYSQIAEFINADPPVEGEPRTEIQNEAIRMKSDEDAIVAREYIDKGGDYKRAISIYEDALRVDPDNPMILEELARAQELRYMSKERFSGVKKGMTEDQVREVLGPPNVYNIREYEDRGVTAWFYPTDEAGAAAAVWFHMKDHKVYRLNFDAVEGRGTDEEDG